MSDTKKSLTITGSEWQSFVPTGATWSKFTTTGFASSKFTLANFTLVDIGEFRLLELSDSFEVTAAFVATESISENTIDSVLATDVVNLAISKPALSMFYAGDELTVYFASDTTDTFALSDVFEIITAKTLGDTFTVAEQLVKAVVINIVEGFTCDDSLDFQYGSSIFKSNVAFATDAIALAVSKTESDTFVVTDSFEIIRDSDINSMIGAFTFGGATLGE